MTISQPTATDQNPRRFNVTLFERRTDTNGRQVAMSWPELRSCLETEPEISTTKDGSCFVFGEFAPDKDGQLHHKKELVREIHALAIDIDDAPTDTVVNVIHELTARGLEFCGWPTFGQLDAPKTGLLRCRLVLPLAEPIKGKDWGRFWPAAMRYLSVEGIADKQCKDVNRLYFHTCPEGKASDFSAFCKMLTNSGTPLDVAAVLESAPAPSKAKPADAECDLNAAPLLDSGIKVERCPAGTSPFQHAESLAKTMPPAVSVGGHEEARIFGEVHR